MSRSGTRPSFTPRPHSGNPPVAQVSYVRDMSQPAPPSAYRGDPSRAGDGMPRNYLRACLLLILAEGSAHGYDMTVQLNRLGLGGVDKGGMYRTLRVLEEDGMVSSGWEASPSGPLRRRYRITSEGRTWLAGWAESVRIGQAFAAGYLRRYERVRRSLSAPPSRTRRSPAA